MDPDELYTLRAQFWLGHYKLCLEEGRSTARRPMTPQLKAEREEILLRAYLALGDYDRVLKDTSDSSPSIQALQLFASYELAKRSNDTDKTESIITELKNLLASSTVDHMSSSLQLYAAHLFLRHDLTRDALQCVHLGTTMEHLAVSLQIYLQMDRLDLAKAQLDLLTQADEDAILTQLGSVYYKLALGKTGADDALHSLSMLSEQYGPSVMLLNITAVAHLTQSNFTEAEQCLTEAKSEGSCDADTYVNLIACYAQQGKDTASLVAEFLQAYPSHPFSESLQRVEGAFEREAVKYRVAA